MIVGSVSVSTETTLLALMGVLIAAASLIAMLWKMYRDHTEAKREFAKRREYACFLFVTTQYDPEGEDLQEMLLRVHTVSDMAKIGKEFYAFRDAIAVLRTVPPGDPDRKSRLLMAMMDIKLRGLRDDLCHVMQKAIGRKPLSTTAPLLRSHCTAPKITL